MNPRFQNPRKMTSKGLVSKETELVWLSFRSLSRLPLPPPGRSPGHSRMCLFPVLISHSLPPHFLSFSFSNFYRLPDTESLPGNQSSRPKYVHSLWERGFHTAQMTHIPKKVLSLHSWPTVVTAVWFFGKEQNQYLLLSGPPWLKKYIHGHSQLIFTSTM